MNYLGQEHRITVIWLLLLALTAVSLAIGETQHGIAAMMLVVVLLLFKSQLVVSWFMGLRRAPMLWRIVMGSYLAIVGIAITTAYLVGLNG